MFYRQTTVRHLPIYSFWCIDKRRSVENDPTSVFSMARVLGIRCSSQHVILVTVATVCYVVGISRCASGVELLQYLFS
jgi:hypothetical protein